MIFEYLMIKPSERFIRLYKYHLKNIFEKLFTLIVCQGQTISVFVASFRVAEFN